MDDKKAWAVMGEYYPSGRLSSCGAVFQSWNYTLGWAADDLDHRFCFGPYVTEVGAKEEVNRTWDDELRKEEK